MGQVFLQGQVSGGKIDFSKLNYQIVFNRYLSPSNNTLTIPGPGLYAISWCYEVYPARLLIRTYDEKNVELGDYFIRIVDAHSKHSEVILDIYDNGNGRFSVYGWKKSTGVYTLITNKAVRFSYDTSGGTDDIFLIIVRLYQ